MKRHWWNSVKFVSITIDIVISLIPVFMTLKNFFKAGKIAQALKKTAQTMSRNKLREAFVEMGLKLANATGWAVIATVGGAVYDIFETISGKTIGSVIANALDKLDGKKDGYLWA